MAKFAGRLSIDITFDSLIRIERNNCSGVQVRYKKLMSTTVYELTKLAYVETKTTQSLFLSIEL